MLVALEAMRNVEDRVSVLRRHLCGASVQTPGNIRTIGEHVVVTWEGYHHLRCFYGRERKSIDSPLFLGFSDGAANVMMVPDPSRRRFRLLLQLEDVLGHSGRSFVFAERRAPRPNLCSLRDLGGWCTSERRSWLRCGLVFEGGEGLAECLDEGDAAFLDSLGVGAEVRVGDEGGPAGGALHGASVIRCPLPGGAQSCRASSAERGCALATNPACAACFGAALRAILKELRRGVAVVIGSTRDELCAGWLSALVLLAAGISEDDVVRDARHDIRPLLSAAKSAAGGLLKRYLNSVVGFSASEQKTLRSVLVASLA